MLTCKKTMLKDSAYSKANESCTNMPFAYFVSKACTHFEDLVTAQKIASDKQVVKNRRILIKKQKIRNNDA